MYLAGFCLSDFNSSIGGKVYDKNPCIEASFIFTTSIQALCVDSKHFTGPQWPWYKATIVKAGDLYSRYRQWFMTKIHGFRLVMLVQRQFKRCVSISNTTLGPSGHDSKPPSSRLGTLYSRCRQWFLTEINVLSLVLFIRHQFKCSELVHKTILSPSGLGTKIPSSRLGTLYSCYRQWFITKIYVLRLFCLSNDNSSVGGRFQTPHWALMAMYEATVVEAGDLVHLLKAMVYDKNTCI